MGSCSSYVRKRLLDAVLGLSAPNHSEILRVLYICNARKEQAPRLGKSFLL